MITVEGVYTLKPSTMAVAATEPIHGAVLSDDERDFWIAELTQMVGPKKAHHLLEEARKFHEAIGNTKVFHDAPDKPESGHPAGTYPAQEYAS